MSRSDLHRRRAALGDAKLEHFSDLCTIILVKEGCAIRVLVLL